MKATISDLRYRFKDVLAAIDRGEPVTIVYRGEEKATLVPVNGASNELVIAYSRGDSGARDLVDSDTDRSISIVSVIEVLQGPRPRSKPDKCSRPATSVTFVQSRGSKSCHSTAPAINRSSAARTSSQYKLMRLRLGEGTAHLPNFKVK
jgi:prevent-host-death family protein